jgi:uncharacterized protein YqeY
MPIVDQINEDIKKAMKAKDKDSLDALRAVKSALLLAATEKGAGGEVSDDAALKVLQKLVKQRKESAEIYVSQKRNDLAEVELQQAAVIEGYLPAQLSAEELDVAVREIIQSLGASGPAEMGKVIGAANKSLAGRAEGKHIADAVKKLLNS